ncbi:unnamed protein product [Caenorhabditis brenneri]
MEINFEIQTLRKLDRDGMSYMVTLSTTISPWTHQSSGQQELRAMEVFKDNILDGIIYTFHFQRFPAAAAHLMLTQMIGVDTCTLQYVEGIYTRIEDKKFNLKKLQLLDMPPHFLENVVEELDVKSRAILRKSCKTLRAFVDHTPLYLEYVTINFDQNPKRMYLYIGDLAVKYYENEEGCLVRHCYGQRQYVKVKMEQLIVDDLKSFLINPNLKIESLIIANQRDNQTSFDEFVRMLSCLEHKLHVEHFEWTLYFNTEDLMKIFSAMKPSTLKSFESSAMMMGSQLNEQLFSLPQWKGAKKLKFTCKVDPTDLIHLAHFDKVVLARENPIDDEEITGEIIMAMKSKLLDNENFDQIVIYETHGLIPVAKIKRILLPFRSPTDRRCAQFDYPNSDKKLLLRVYSDHIWFKGPCYESDEGEEMMMGLHDYESEEEMFRDEEVDETDEEDEEDEEDDEEIEEDSSESDEEFED